MLEKEKLIEEQKEFAEMLGMSLKEYEAYCNDNKVNSKMDLEDDQHDDSILEKLGLSKKDLLIR